MITAIKFSGIDLTRNLIEVVRLGQMEKHIVLLDLHINLFQFHSGNSRFIFSWVK